MSVHYPTVFRKDTGEIVSTGMFSCSEELVEANFSARLGMYGELTHDIIDLPANQEQHYVTVLEDQPVMLDRPEIPYQIDKVVILAGGEDFCTISGLHDPCEVVIDDPDPLVETLTVTVTGGSFEFSAEVSGTYTIQIDKFPFLLLTLEIVAVDPEALETASFSSDFSYEFGL